MRPSPSDARALAQETLRLLVENSRLKLAFAFRQLEDALGEASHRKRGLVAAWRLWREMRREHHLAFRLLRLGSHPIPQDAAGITAACRTWEKTDLPGGLQAESLDRATRFAPDHAWNPEKMRRVGSGCGLTPDGLLQVLREKQGNASGSPQD